MNSKRKKIYEGKAKILYEGPEPGTLIQYFEDDATAFNAQKKAVLEGKGVVNNQISEFIMSRLNGIGVTNHFIKRLNLREQLIREVEIIPLEVVCRNIVAGSMSQRLGIEEGTPLPRSIIEFYYKKDELNDPMVTEEHITAFNWASTQELDDMLAMTVRVNDYLSGMFSAVGITLVDFKIEFGRVWENDFSRVLLADEISPDSCRLWDTASGEKLDKDRFRRDLGNVIESYTEVARRLGIMKGMPTVIQEDCTDGPSSSSKVKVHVFLKPGVLDVQGKAVEGALQGLGWSGVSNARVGKLIGFDLAGAEDPQAEARKMCEQLLANTVIESYRIEAA